MVEPKVTPDPPGSIAVSDQSLASAWPEDWRNPDILLAGGGLSGLTMAIELARQPFFENQRILLLDREEKANNDRTWCFWATTEEPLPPVIFQSWDQCKFYGAQLETTLAIAPFRYHMVRGLDFYRWAKQELAGYPNVRRLTTNILSIDAATGMVRTENGDFTAGRIFNSAFTQRALLPDASHLYPQPPFTSPARGTKTAGDPYVHLLQHFQGWILETPTPAFDPHAMTFMDYRLEQHGQTRFVYVLPFSETRALVEFTVFSEHLCPAEAYDQALQDYIRNQLKINDFKIVEREFGVIPMTDQPFSTTQGRVTNIGTAGGFVKASSGYAFLRTQRRLRAFVADWVRRGQPDPALLRSARRYRFFDSVMLRVLQNGQVTGKDFFTGLFRQLPAPLVFRFLDEDAGFLETLRLLSAPPTLPFLRA
ncbi:MAG: lycopene cyclase family protein, partial [Saprospiraceae bacterium]